MKEFRMLDNEPDTNQPTPGTEPTSEQPKAAAPRRRRAASRPAGPPAPSTAPAETVGTETSAAPAEPAPAQPEAPAAEAQPALTEPLPAKKPARKAAAKRPAKKAAAPPVEATAEPAADAPAEEPAAEAPAPRKRAPRKRVAKKAAPAAAEQSADDLVAEAAVTPEAAVELVPEAAPAEEAQPSPAEPVAPEAPTADAAWAGEEAVAEVPAEAVQELADAIAADHPTQDQLDEALEETPAADLRPLEESPLDVLETTQDDSDREVQVPPSDVDSETAAAGVAPDAIDFSAAPTTPPQADDAAPSLEENQTAGSDESETTGDSDDSDDDSDDESESREGDGSRRRRRRRGGRRRRRSGGDDDSNDADDQADATDGSAAPADDEADAPAADSSADDSASDDETSDDSESEGDGSRRRRRRRRRRGEDTGGAADDPGEVVVRVREPRRANTKSASSEVTGIEGSTRMEAKRQRRRDGREAGRRRAPILSEAEFLARRESVSRKMIIRQADDLSQIAVIEDDILVEHYVDRDSAASLIGNVYLGRVQNVLPSMEAAFIDIGRGRNAVLYAGEVDWDSFGAEGQGRKVERVLKSGQTILVQVTKDPVGAKGARLTNHVSIPGRYIVYAPSGHLSGISRKLPDTERRRLKEILADLIGEASVIVRTAAEGASEEELVRDVNRLKAQWADIEKKVNGGQSPQLLYGEPDLTVRIVRDLFTEDFSELIIQGNGQANDAYDAVEAYVTHVAPHLKDRLRAWDPNTNGDLFAEFRLDEQIAKGLERKVFLPSGGSLVIDRTEAMTVIDVNTGKFTGSGGNLEATVTSNNLEAAEEIVRQLRLRDIGGIIVIDFIDMVLPNNRELLLRRLVECLGRDRTRHQVAEVTSLGLVQMTRKKIGTGLAEAFTTECPHCHGRGFEIHDMPVESQRQADGGTRDSGRRDNRRGGSGNGSGNGGGHHHGGNGNGKPSIPAELRPEQEPVVETDVAPVPSEAHANQAPANEAAANEPAPVETPTEPVAQEAAERAPRSRRSGTRRRATREQGAPTVADPQAAPAADPQGEPVPSS
jgi:ribonuclease E